MKKTAILILAMLSLMACGKDDSPEIDMEQEIPDAEEPIVEDPVPDPPANNAPDSFNLIEVANNAVDIDVLPTMFSWEAATDPDGDAVSYSMFLDQEENPTTPLVEDITATNFETTERLGLYETYYWNVVASDTEGATTTSSTNTFSTRGINFETATAINEAPQFSGRFGHTSVVFDNKIWVIGGSESGARTNDVWYSSDGITWIEATDEAEFSPRLRHTSVVFDNKIWVIGGEVSVNRGIGDAWYSSDGVTWTEATNDAGFFSIVAHTSVVFDDKMWVIGGSVTGLTDDVWYSSDGVSWTLATGAAEFPARATHTSIVFDDKIWVIGGSGRINSGTNVWFSSDGITWEEATDDAGFSSRTGHSSVVFDNKMWSIAGRDPSAFNDVWFSRDGITWEQATDSAVFSDRFEHSSVVFDNKIWVIGGAFSGQRFNDVWAFE